MRIFIWLPNVDRTTSSISYKVICNRKQSAREGLESSGKEKKHNSKSPPGPDLWTKKNIASYFIKDYFCEKIFPPFFIDSFSLSCSKDL